MPKPAHEVQYVPGCFRGQRCLQDTVMRTQGIRNLHLAAIPSIDLLGAMKVFRIWSQYQQGLTCERVWRDPLVCYGVHALHVRTTLVAKDLELLPAEALPLRHNEFIGLVLESLDVALVRL